MKRKDYLIVAFLPLALLFIPLTGQLTVDGWHWTWTDFLFAWVVFSITTFVFRFLVTRPMANLAYKAGVALAVLAGFLVFWITAAVQIIGDDNPGNLLYLLSLLGGFAGMGVSRFQPVGLSRVAFAMAAALLLIPVVAVLNWPTDFNPGYLQAQLLSAGLATLFLAAGLLFRRAGSQAGSELTAAGGNATPCR
jgi:hypothetical protein